MIYLNHAATSVPKPQPVIEAVVQAMESCGSASRGNEQSTLEANRLLYTLRKELAELLGFSCPERVVFTMNATQALNTVLLGMFHPGDHIVTTVLEHNSVLRPLHILERDRGVSVDYIGADSRGVLLYEELERRIRPNTRAIVATHASNLTGNVVDILRLHEIAERHGLYLIVDAAQTAGAREIRMEDMGIHVLCFTGHKSLLGPQGTGGLLVSPEVELSPLLSGGTGILSFEEFQPACYPEHLEAGTPNLHGLAGLLAAVRFLKEQGIRRISQRENRLAEEFYEGVREIPGIQLYGDFSSFAERAPIVSLNLEGLMSSELADILAEDYGIAVRAGGHCAPLMHRCLGTDRMGAVRFSFGYSSTREDVEAAVKALREIREGI